MSTDRANNLLSHIRSFGVQWGEESAEIVKSADHNIQQIEYFPEWLGGGVCFNGQHHTIVMLYFEPRPQQSCEARPKNLWDGESYQPFINWEI